MRKLFTLLLLLICSAKCGAYCFQDAGKLDKIDPLLIIAIADGESSLNQFAQNVNYKHGKPVSEDIGVMQVNSTWLPKLKEYGITRELLYTDPCLNVKVGTWILVSGCDLKNMSWDCIGAYNAGPSKNNGGARLKYSIKVYNKYRKLKTDQKALDSVLAKIPNRFKLDRTK